MKKSIILLLIFTISFAFFGFSQPQAGTGAIVDKIIGIVGNKIIKISDVESQYLQMKAQGVPVNDKSKCKIFEELLIQKLMVNQALIDSIEVNDMQVMSEIDRRVAIFSERAGGDDKLVEYFNKSIPEIKKDFEEIVRDQLLMQQMQQEIVGELKVTPKEINHFFESIPQDSLPEIPEQIELSQIIIEPTITLEAKRFAKNKLQNYRKRIVENGDDFAVLASLYSEDPGSAAKGGELGFMSKGAFVKEFSEAAFKLKKGEISNVIETEFGYHIIELIEKRGDEANFRHILITPKVANEAKIAAKNKLDSLATAIRTDSITFAVAALIYSTDKTTKNNGGIMMNPHTGDTKFEMNQIHPSMNYVVKGLKIGEISAPFITVNDKGREVYAIIKLMKQSPAHTANLKSDYKLIQDFALQKKQQDVVRKWVNDKIKTTYIKIDELYKKCNFEEKTWLNSL